MSIVERSDFIKPVGPHLIGVEFVPQLQNELISLAESGGERTFVVFLGGFKELVLQ